jgi:hypothetical protein
VIKSIIFSLMFFSLTICSGADFLRVGNLKDSRLEDISALWLKVFQLIDKKKLQEGPEKGEMKTIKFQAVIRQADAFAFARMAKEVAVTAKICTPESNPQFKVLKADQNLAKILGSMMAKAIVKMPPPALSKEQSEMLEELAQKLKENYQLFYGPGDNADKDTAIIIIIDGKTSEILLLVARRVGP